MQESRPVRQGSLLGRKGAHQLPHFVSSLSVLFASLFVSSLLCVSAFCFCISRHLPSIVCMLFLYSISIAYLSR